MQWHQLGHMQVCTSLQTDNHASTPPLSFLQAGCLSCRPTNSIKALKEKDSLSDSAEIRCCPWWASLSISRSLKSGRRTVPAEHSPLGHSPTPFWTLRTTPFVHGGYSAQYAAKMQYPTLAFGGLVAEWLACWTQSQ